MGYFCKYKKSDYSLEQCKKKCEKIIKDIVNMSDTSSHVKEKYILMRMRQWAEFRELQARHEKQNHG